MQLVENDIKQKDMYDEIDLLVRNAKSDDKSKSNCAYEVLLYKYTPLFKSLCNKWRGRFKNMRSYDELMSECMFWFFHYTSNVFDPEHGTHFSAFIKATLDTRLRYIYQSDNKYKKRNMLTNNVMNVIDKYIESGLIDSKYNDKQFNEYFGIIISHISSLIKSMDLDSRERDMLYDRIIRKSSHYDISKKFNITRGRVSQILSDLESTAYKIISEDEYISLLADNMRELLVV